MEKLSQRANRLVLKQVREEKALLREKLKNLDAFEEYLVERLDSISEPVKQTQIDAVQLVIRSDPSRVWTVADVYDALEEMEFEFGAKSPKSSLSVTLKHLANRKFVDEVSIVGSNRTGYALHGVLKNKRSKEGQ